MLLIEADGKALFAEYGIAVPAGVVVTDVVPALPGDGPWMVKAQVPVGGRGKAGGIVRCDTRAEVEAAVARMLGGRLKGHAVDACLVEAVAARARTLHFDYGRCGELWVAGDLFRSGWGRDRAIRGR